MSFKERVVIVTGGASGIGLATAQRFAEEGAYVVIADLDEQRNAAALQALTSSGSAGAWSCVCDVGEESQVVAAVDGAIERFGRLDVIVNNAGLMLFKPIVELDADDWQRVLNVDLLGAFFFIKQAFLKMRPGGAVVNISSIHAVQTEPLVAPYAAAKAAMLSLTRSAALESGSRDIRINAVLPGAVDTPMLWDNPNVKSGVEVIHREAVGSPMDIAQAVLFLASDEARFIQGASVTVDGGRLTRL